MSDSLGKRLERARALAGVSARELDRLAELGQGHTRLIETGERPRISGETATALAGTLGVSLDWLLSGTGSEPIKTAIASAIAAKRAARAADESGPHVAVDVEKAG